MAGHAAGGSCLELLECIKMSKGALGAGVLPLLVGPLVPT